MVLKSQPEGSLGILEAKEQCSRTLMLSCCGVTTVSEWSCVSCGTQHGKVTALLGTLLPSCVIRCFQMWTAGKTEYTLDHWGTVYIPSVTKALCIYPQSLRPLYIPSITEVPCIYPRSPRPFVYIFNHWGPLYIPLITEAPCIYPRSVSTAGRPSHRAVVQSLPYGYQPSLRVYFIFYIFLYCLPVAQCL